MQRARLHRRVTEREQRRSVRRRALGADPEDLDAAAAEPALLRVRRNGELAALDPQLPVGRDRHGQESRSTAAVQSSKSIVGCCGSGAGSAGGGGGGSVADGAGGMLCPRTATGGRSDGPTAHPATATRPATATVSTRRSDRPGLVIIDDHLAGRPV